MKRVISAFIVLILLSGLCSIAFAASTANDAANALYELGLFGGVGTNANGTPNFDLNRAPTRQEAVTMLVRLLGKESEATRGNWETPFTDVADWAKPYVGYAYTNSLAFGTDDTIFGGDTQVSASQYLTFVLRALGYDSSTDFAWDSAWTLSDELGLTNGEYGSGNTFLRADIAKISYDAMNMKLKGKDQTLIQALVNDGAVESTKATAQGFDLYGWTESVHFLYDIRTFTLYAFMNYTGYDDNNGRPITGVRKAVRDDLASMNLKLSRPNYVAEKNILSHYYGNALRNLGAAPDFSYISSNDIPSGLSDLPGLLKEFYLAADIPSLYEKYRPDYEQTLASYKESLPAIVKMVSYLRADVGDYQEFGVEVNLLDAFERGSGLGAVDSHYGYGIIRTGPSNEVNTINILHEYAHGFVGQELKKLTSEVNALSKYYDASSNAVTQQYSGWSEIVNESFVRAFSIYFDTNIARRDSIIARDTNDGFTLTQYLYDRIPEFAAFNGTLGEFMRMLLVEYPQHR